MMNSVADAPSESCSPQTSGVYTLPCPKCKHQLRVSRQVVGSYIRCVSCESIWAVAGTDVHRSAGERDPVALFKKILPCPGCGNRLHLVPELVGHQIRCNACQAVLRVTEGLWRRPGSWRSASSPQQADQGRSEGPIQESLGSVGLAKPNGEIDEDEVLEILGAVPVESGNLQSDFEAKIEARNARPVTAPVEPRETGASDGGGPPQDVSEHESPPTFQPELSSADASPDALSTETSEVETESEPKTRRPVPDRAVPRRHGRSDARVSWTGPALVPTLTTLAILAAVAGLTAVGWRVVAGGSAHPETRYLPDQCDLFISIQWQDLAGSGFSQTADEISGLGLVQRCATFLNNAGLEPADVERINAGRAADGSGLLVVYRLTQPVEPDTIMEQPRFRQAKYEQEEVRGTPVYTHVLGGRAIAFPEEQIILNGEVELVRDSLRRRGRGARAPSSRLVEAADFSAMCVQVTDGAPRPLFEAHCQQCGQLADSVRGTTERFEYGQELEFVRVLHLDSQRAAGELQRSLQSSLAAVVTNPSASGAVRQVLASAKVSAAKDEVQIRLTLDADQLSPESLDSLKRLF